jgi:hypothetical protein
VNLGEKKYQTPATAALGMRMATAATARGRRFASRGKIWAKNAYPAQADRCLASDRPDAHPGARTVLLPTTFSEE